MPETEDKRVTRTPKLNIGVRVTPEQVAWLASQARDNGTSMSIEIRRAIDEAMERDS